VQEFPGRNALFTLVLQEIASPLWFRHFSCEEIERSVSHAARSVGIEGLLLREVRTLSGGEQILCALATAVVANPTVLVLDEWDYHLDWETAAHVDACIREMHLPYVVRCTQDMDIAASADEVIFLDRGKVTFAGAPQAVFPPLISTCWYPPSWSLEEWNSSSTKYL
jgi:energy-coupling factor transport system ATP-binding protein